MIHVIIVDAKKLVREGFQVLLSRVDDIQVAGEARDGQQAVEMARELAPDVILMDIRMPRLNGLDATRQIVGLDLATRVLMVAMQCDAESVQQAFEYGARGFVAKSEAYTELITAIRSVADGQRYCSPAIARLVADRKVALAAE
jgi:DNA-binding NarL/FixJ family response regulator